MAMEKTLGGDRLGSGKKMKVYLHNYERSTHDLGYLWRSTMSAGTLVPFMKLIALPGDTFDINLDCDIKTHPTIGPLFGSYKVQLDVFQAPIRLYNGALHNNKLGIGLHMENVMFPTITLKATKNEQAQPDNRQINPSCILAYLGIRGIGYILPGGDTDKTRDFNVTPLLAYWDIYKQYYSNKQEEVGWVIHTPAPGIPNQTVTAMEADGNPIPAAPGVAAVNLDYNGVQIEVTYTPDSPTQVMLNTTTGQYLLADLFYNSTDNSTDTILYYNYKWAEFGNLVVINYTYFDAGDIPNLQPGIQSFDLKEIDDMREKILGAANFTATGVAFNLNIDANTTEPYNLLWDGDNQSLPFSQEGLGLKTYQSDIFNNWLRTEYIDEINAVTAVSTAGDEFTIDALNLAKKVYEMLNRIAVSGGTYDDWLDAVYMHDRIQRAESPIYHGGLIKELVFQEVVSNAAAESQADHQVLGTLAGKGIMGKKHKGGNVIVKVDEPSIIMGIISLTPRIDYSQGNDWDVHLASLNDLHKPALDEIGFQELMTEQMAWWSTRQITTGGPWVTPSAGKQPAWINYQTNFNKTYGNFAIDTNEMYMTLNRRYQADGDKEIDDLTTYIDPSKFNFIFAQTAIDAQNFWAQVAVDITARRKMSAKLMPNL